MKRNFLSIRQLSIFSCLILPFWLIGQEHMVTGTVISSDDQQPLIGATILIKGTGQGTTTDLDGYYEIRVSGPGDTLRYSYTGYAPYETEVGVRSVIDVSLDVDVHTIDEIVVIGYGTMRKSDLTGSVYSVKGDDLVKNPDANAIQALQGKVPGVQVSSSSGNPGESPVVRIRGVSTFLGGASPVYVVDGVILDDISFLNSGDIASIEVLKDASATAIYGTRGANGVIIITTKMGSVEGKPVVTASASYSVESIANRIDVLGKEEFAAVANELIPGTYNNIDVLPDTDWQEEIFQGNAPIQKYELSVGGGTEKFQYYVGGSFYNQEGIIPKSDYQRIALKLNNTLEAADFLTFGSNLSFSKEDKTNPPGVVSTALRAWPTEAPFDANGNFQALTGTGNPLASIEYSNNFTDRYRTVSNLFADVEIIKNLIFRSSYQLDWGFIKNVGFSPVFFVSPAQMNEINDLSKTDREEQSWIWENTLRYSMEVNDDHRFDLLAGYTSQKTTSEGITATVENLIREDEDFWYIDAGDATTIDAFNNRSQFSYISYLFRANYTLMDKYLFTATYRRDGSSKFGPNNRYGDFPSVALGWRISQEPFLYGNELISNLKLRASWGINGNDKIPYEARYARVSSSNLEGVFGPDEKLYPGATLSNAGNPNLQWENTETFDVGIEFGLLDNRLSGEIEYYNKQTDRVLVPLLLPSHFGNGPFNRVVFNAADVRNSGLEFYLNWKHRLGEFTYNVVLLGSTVENEVTGIGAANEFIQDGSLGNGTLATRTQVGIPVGSFFGYNVVGIFQDEGELNSLPSASGQRVGDLRYEDTNGDGVITPDDRTFIGSYIPDFLGGLNFSLGYKGVELAIDLQGQFGNEIYNGKRAVRPELYNYESYIEDRWTGSGTSTTEPRLTAGGTNYQNASSWFIEDGSFIRLRSVSLSYAIPANFLDKAGITSATVFLRGTNVFTATEFSGYSPELASPNVLSSGIDLGTYPITSTYSIGLNVSL